MVMLPMTATLPSGASEPTSAATIVLHDDNARWPIALRRAMVARAPHRATGRIQAGFRRGARKSPWHAAGRTLEGAKDVR